MTSEKKVFILLTALLLVGASAVWAARVKGGSQATSAKATPAKQARTWSLTGTIVSFTPTSLVVSHEVKGKKTDTTFVLNPETKQEGTLANGARAQVHYRVENNQNVATMVEVHQPKHAAAPKTSRPKY